jgi:hypothetical protein
MNTTHRPRPALLRTGLGWRWPALASLLLALAVFAAGCAGLAALAGWAAAAGSIDALVNDLDPSNPTYTLTGYIYVNSTTNTIAIENAPTPPAGGGYQVYPNAPMYLDTTPPNVTTSNSLGYFQFTSIPESQSTYLLTITTPTGSTVQYSVDLATLTITPVATSQSRHPSVR